MIYPADYTEEDIFNDNVDSIYALKYLHEMMGVSYKIVSASVDISFLLYSYIKQKEECIIYTGYNWDFNIENFININDCNKPYPLYITLYNISKLVDNYIDETNNKIIIYVPNNLLNQKLQDHLYNTLNQYKKDHTIYKKDITSINKTTVYNNTNLTNNIQELHNNILTYINETELYTCKQNIYDYIYNHPDITNIDISDKEFEKIVNLENYYYSWLAFYQYIRFAADIYILQVLTLKLGLLLKLLFNYKNQKLTEQYVNNVISNNEKFDKSICFSMSDFIHNKINQYLRNVAKTIYQAITDRDKIVITFNYLHSIQNSKDDN